MGNPVLFWGFLFFPLIILFKNVGLNESLDFSLVFACRVT